MEVLSHTPFSIVVPCSAHKGEGVDLSLGHREANGQPVHQTAGRYGMQLKGLWPHYLVFGV